MIKLFVLLLMMSAVSKAEEVNCDNAFTTYDMNVCAGRDMEQADAKLDKYLTAAKERYVDEPDVVASLDKSQQAWLTYRQIYCDGIYDLWSDGTIRGVMFASCVIALTEQHTHQLWLDYLTYMDSTDPILPEPNLARTKETDPNHSSDD